MELRSHVQAALDGRPFACVTSKVGVGVEWYACRAIKPIVTTRDGLFTQDRLWATVDARVGRHVDFGSRLYPRVEDGVDV